MNLSRPLKLKAGSDWVVMVIVAGTGVSLIASLASVLISDVVSLCRNHFLTALVQSCCSCTTVDEFGSVTAPDHRWPSEDHISLSGGRAAPLNICRNHKQVSNVSAENGFISWGAIKAWTPLSLCFVLGPLNSSWSADLRERGVYKAAVAQKGMVGRDHWGI